MPALRLPRRFSAPATIGIFAASGIVDIAANERAVAYFEGLGHRVVIAPHVACRWRTFAGTDEERLDGFHQLLADPSIDVLMQVRGGYGWSRLLHRLDYDAIAASDKIIVGFSDMTALNLAALSRTGRVSFAGPMSAVDFGNGDVAAFMEAHFWPLLAGASHGIDVRGSDHAYPPQLIAGTIWGGNLSLLTHLVGTPYFPAIDGGILFVEELAEEPYAVERLFFQLYHAGILPRQHALVLADFKHCQPATGRYPYSMNEVVDTLRKLLPYPVLTGLPFGHVREKITLPVGGHGTLRIADNSYRLDFSAYNFDSSLARITR